MYLIDLHSPRHSQQSTETGAVWATPARGKGEPGEGNGEGARDENRSEPVGCAPRAAYSPVAVWGSIGDPGPPSRAVAP